MAQARSAAARARDAEAMRSASHRDATLLSVLAHAGLRPSEALALNRADVRTLTILVQRALSLGEDADTKTHQHRTVRLLAPLLEDLERWWCSVPGNALVFPGHDGDPWSLVPGVHLLRRASGGT